MERSRARSLAVLPALRSVRVGGHADRGLALPSQRLRDVQRRPAMVRHALFGPRDPETSAVCPASGSLSPTLRLQQPDVPGGRRGHRHGERRFLVRLRATTHPGSSANAANGAVDQRVAGPGQRRFTAQEPGRRIARAALVQLGFDGGGGRRDFQRERYVVVDVGPAAGGPPRRPAPAVQRGLVASHVVAAHDYPPQPRRRCGKTRPRTFARMDSVGRYRTTMVASPCRTAEDTTGCSRA